jgi:hypothetical protein
MEMTMIALNPQPLPPHADVVLTADVASHPTLLRPIAGGCPTCTSGRFLIWQAAVDGETAVPLQVTLPNVGEVG